MLQRNYLFTRVSSPERIPSDDDPSTATFVRVPASTTAPLASDSGRDAVKAAAKATNALIPNQSRGGVCLLCDADAAVCRYTLIEALNASETSNFRHAVSCGRPSLLIGRKDRGGGKLLRQGDKGPVLIGESMWGRIDEGS